MAHLSFFTAAMVAAFAMLPTSSRAAVAVYDFETLAFDATTPFALTASGLGASFAGPVGVDPGAFGLGFNSPGGPLGAPYRTLVGAFLTVGPAFGAIGSPLVITFSQPVTAVSLQFALDDTARTTTLTLSTNAGGTASSGGTIGGGFRYPEGAMTVGGSPFTALTLTSNAPDFQVDNVNVTFEPDVAVPEPASLLLLGAAITATAVVRRRNRH